MSIESKLLLARMHWHQRHVGCMPFDGVDKVRAFEPPILLSYTIAHALTQSSG